MKLFEVGETYIAKDNNSFKIRIESRTKRFLRIRVFIDGVEDALFKGSGRHKTEILRGFEYFCDGLFQYQADNFELAAKI